MIGLTYLQVYKSISNIAEENNKFQLYPGPLYTDLNYTTLKTKVAEVRGLSDISSEDFEKVAYERDFIQIYRKLLLEKSQTDAYFIVNEVTSITISRFRKFSQNFNWIK